MKKKIFSLLLSLVVLLTLAACSKQETVTSSALADEAEQNIKETEAQEAGAMKRQSSERTSSRQS